MNTVAIHALTSSSWLHVGDLPDCFRTSGCIVLPSGELVVIGGEREHRLSAYSTPVYKASLIGTFCNGYYIQVVSI